MAAVESELPRPGRESPAPSVPPVSDNSESKNGKNVKPQVGLGSWQGSGQKEGAGQVSLPNPCVFFCNFPTFRSQLLLPGCHYGDGLASPPLWGLLGPGGEPRKSAEYDDDVAIYSE